MSEHTEYRREAFRRLRTAIDRGTVTVDVQPVKLIVEFNRYGMPDSAEKMKPIRKQRLE